MKGKKLLAFILTFIALISTMIGQYILNDVGTSIYLMWLFLISANSGIALKEAIIEKGGK